MTIVESFLDRFLDYQIIILDFTTPFVKNAKTPYFGSDENSRNDHKNPFFRKVHK